MHCGGGPTCIKASAAVSWKEPATREPRHSETPTGWKLGLFRHVRTTPTAEVVGAGGAAHKWRGGGIHLRHRMNMALWPGQRSGRKKFSRIFGSLGGFWVGGEHTKVGGVGLEHTVV